MLQPQGLDNMHVGRRHGNVIMRKPEISKAESSAEVQSCNYQMA